MGRFDGGALPVSGYLPGPVRDRAPDRWSRRRADERASPPSSGRMLPRRIPAAISCGHRRDAGALVRVASRGRDGRPASRDDHPAAPGRARPVGSPPGTPAPARTDAPSLDRRRRRTLDLLRPYRRRRVLAGRAARTAPRRIMRHGRMDGDRARRRDRRHAASGNDLAVVEQGDRHRPASAASKAWDRIERGVAWSMTCASGPARDCAEALAESGLLHDRMTQCALVPGVSGANLDLPPPNAPGSGTSGSSSPGARASGTNPGLPPPDASGSNTLGAGASGSSASDPGRSGWGTSGAGAPSFPDAGVKGLFFERRALALDAASPLDGGAQRPPGGERGARSRIEPRRARLPPRAVQRARPRPHRRPN